MRAFSARGCAPPVRASARLYREQSGRDVEIAVCSQACKNDEHEPGALPHGFVPEVSAGGFDMAISGSEADMDDLERAGHVLEGSRRSLGLRQAAILVPAGNPAGVRDLADLARPGIRIAVSTIDCLKGVWEDVCGRAGMIDSVRRNISLRVAGCMALVDAVRTGRIDAAFGWSSFVHFHDKITAIALPGELRIQRSTCGAVIKDASEREAASQFLEFLGSARCDAIFEQKDWLRPEAS